MPMRTLGRTGAQVSILAFGGGSRFVSYGEEKGIEVLNKALDQGITYIDTAESYGNGASQTTVGKALKARGSRKGLWLASKIGAPRDYDDLHAPARGQPQAPPGGPGRPASHPRADGRRTISKPSRQRAARTRPP